jgi:Protein of unknown function (DUF1761)
MWEFGDINYWAVLVAWLVNVVIGAFWYSPAGFGAQWSKYTGVDMMKIPQNEATKIIIFVAVSGLVQAMTLATVVAGLGAATAIEGLQVGLLLWFGMVTATTVGNTLYQGLGWRFLALNSSYFLVVMQINAVILAVW